MTKAAETRILRTELAKEFAKKLLEHESIATRVPDENVAGRAVSIADELMTRLGYGEGEGKA